MANLRQIYKTKKETKRENRKIRERRMKVRNTLETIKYRFELRKAFKKATLDQLIITKEELNKEFNKRNKSKWQKKPHQN